MFFRAAGWLSIYSHPHSQLQRGVDSALDEESLVQVYAISPCADRPYS